MKIISHAIVSDETVRSYPVDFFSEQAGILVFNDRLLIHRKVTGRDFAYGIPPTSHILFLSVRSCNKDKLKYLPVE